MYPRHPENPERLRAAAVRVVSRFAAQVDLKNIHDTLDDLKALSDNLSEVEETFDAHFG